MSKTIDEYTLGKQLGAGATAKVYEALNDQGNEFAIKVFDTTNPRVSDQVFQYLLKETEAARNLNHRHIVGYHAFKQNATFNREGKDPKTVHYVVMERVRGGELFDFICYGGAFDERTCRYFFKQALEGLHHIHTRGFAHRDLKPENIMLTDQNDVKIVDFGFAIETEGKGGLGITRSCKGTPGYMAPEIEHQNDYQPHVVDLFALGTILFVMRAAQVPFKRAASFDRHYAMIIKNESDTFWAAHEAPHRDEPGFFSPEFKDLVTNMLRFQPATRICTADIIGHPWLTNPDVATPEEIRADFAERKQKIDQVHKEAEEEKREKKDRPPPGNVHRDVCLDDKVYLIGDDAPKNPDNVAKQAVRLNVKDFNPEMKHPHCMFSTWPRDRIWDAIFDSLKSRSRHIEISEKQLRMKFEAKEVAENQDSQAAAQDQEQQEQALEDQCFVQVDVLRVPGQDKHCINFTRVGGSAVYFYDVVQIHMEDLEDFQDTGEINE